MKTILNDLRRRAERLTKFHEDEDVEYQVHALAEIVVELLDVLQSQDKVD